jgi:hypothetical protein
MIWMLAAPTFSFEALRTLVALGPLAPSEEQAATATSNRQAASRFSQGRPIALPEFTNSTTAPITVLKKFALL